jgi:hypothetical protein
MKKLIATVFITLLIHNVFAQYESKLKIGSSLNTDSYFGGKAGLYLQGGFGYRFLADKRVTLIPMIFIDKSDYSSDDLTFGGMTGANGYFTYETSTLSYQLYSAGLKISSELKFLNLEKKANFYIAPSLGYRRILTVYQKSSNPNLDVSKNPTISQGPIIDWEFELGVKINRFKIGLSLRDVLNKGNKSHSSFAITNAFGVNVAYLFGAKGSKKEVVEEE